MPEYRRAWTAETEKLARERQAAREADPEARIRELEAEIARLREENRNARAEIAVLESMLPGERM